MYKLIRLIINRLNNRPRNQKPVNTEQLRASCKALVAMDAYMIVKRMAEAICDLNGAKVMPITDRDKEIARNVHTMRIAYNMLFESIEKMAKDFERLPQPVQQYLSAALPQNERPSQRNESNVVVERTKIVTERSKPA